MNKMEISKNMSTPYDRDKIIFADDFMRYFMSLYDLHPNPTYLSLIADEFRGTEYKAFNDVIKHATHYLYHRISVFNTFGHFEKNRYVNESAFLAFEEDLHERYILGGFNAAKFLHYCCHMTYMSISFYMKGISGAPDKAIECMIKSLGNINMITSRAWNRLSIAAAKYMSIMQPCGFTRKSLLPTLRFQWTLVESEDEDVSETEDVDAEHVKLAENTCNDMKLAKEFEHSNELNQKGVTVATGEEKCEDSLHIMVQSADTNAYISKGEEEEPNFLKESDMSVMRSGASSADKAENKAKMTLTVPGIEDKCSLDIDMLMKIQNDKDNASEQSIITKDTNIIHKLLIAMEITVKTVDADGTNENKPKHPRESKTTLFAKRQNGSCLVDICMEIMTRHESFTEGVSKYSDEFKISSTTDADEKCISDKNMDNIGGKRSSSEKVNVGSSSSNVFVTEESIATAAEDLLGLSQKSEFKDEVSTKENECVLTLSGEYKMLPSTNVDNSTRSPTRNVKHEDSVEETGSKGLDESEMDVSLIKSESSEDTKEQNKNEDQDSGKEEKWEYWHEYENSSCMKNYSSDFNKRSQGTRSTNVDNSTNINEDSIKEESESEDKPNVIEDEITSMKEDKLSTVNAEFSPRKEDESRYSDKSKMEMSSVTAEDNQCDPTKYEIMREHSDTEEVLEPMHSVEDETVDSSMDVDGKVLTGEAKPIVTFKEVRFLDPSVYFLVMHTNELGEYGVANLEEFLQEEDNFNGSLNLKKQF